jgi:excisionase family DNA binding protein
VSDEPTQHRFLTISQAAEELNVQQSLIQGLMRTGELRAFQVGARGLWRLGRQDVEATSLTAIGAPQNASQHRFRSR